MAKALSKYMRYYDIVKRRVMGIDACSLEIGCRPETFATEFRFLRKSSTMEWGNKWYMDQTPRYKEFGITYHAGEDFLDIADGLRAIDEAILFLQMKKGDRLGHALALGINADDYYRCKRYNVYLTKQDYLDNLIWMLYRSLELNVEINGNQRAYMQEKARTLLSEIYGNCRKSDWTGDMLDLYYFSWLLRGDHPGLYGYNGYNETDRYYVDLYRQCIRRDGGLEKYRKNKKISEFYYLYHYDKDVKIKGLEPIGISIDREYINLVNKLQQVMRMEVLKKGIAIECNPTSNVLIGTFKSYENHPILNFNRYYLEKDANIPNMQVSINTDDLGVFDTSLENEYALMLCAILRKRHREGNYNDDEVYDYLNYIRENGIHMAFGLDSK